MRLLSWSRAGRPRITPEELGYALAATVVESCSSKNLEHMRSSLQIPRDAVRFDSEFFYLQVFLELFAFEACFRDKASFCMETTKCFVEQINNEVREGDAFLFETSSDMMWQRYEQYSELHANGAAFLERLPLEFLIKCGCRPPSLPISDTSLGMPLLTLPLWIGNILLLKKEMHQETRKRYLLHNAC